MARRCDILLTGAGSFVGGHVLARLAREDLAVTATTRTPLRPDHPAHRFANVDLRLLHLGHADDFRGLPNSIDTVVHIAAASSDRHNTEELQRTNVTGTSHLIDYATAAGARRLIYTSSMSIYGRIVSPTVDQDTPIDNPDAYGSSKLAGERKLEACADILPSVSIRLPGVLGRGAKRHWLASVTEAAIAGKMIDIFNPAAPFNNAVDVDDLSEFVEFLCRSDLSGSARFPVACDGMTTIEQAVRTIVSELGSTSSVNVSQARQTSFTIDNRAAKTFGFRPRDIDAAIRKFARAQAADCRMAAER